MFEDFKRFLVQGNLVELAIGFTVGAAFSTVVKSLVEDIIMPPVGLLLGNADFNNLFYVLQAGSENNGPYATLSEAQAAGAITINYGLFFNNVLSLLIVAVTMFVIIKFLAQLQLEENSNPRQK